VVSNAFLISKKTAAMYTSLLKFKVTWSMRCGTVVCLKAKVAQVQYVVSLDVPLDYSEDDFLKYLAHYR
jgi:hypothetical protein